MCEKMANFKRYDLLQHLKNVSFPDATLKQTIKFDENLEVSAMYDIWNVQGMYEGIHSFVRVGRWNGERTDGKINGQLGH